MAVNDKPTKLDRMKILLARASLGAAVVAPVVVMVMRGPKQPPGGGD